ncbi:MAG: metallophosphoesterase family protein [Anaerolineales bacterium]|jgi:putative phosphoesterase
MAITLGLIADTHIPDRRSSLHPQILATFKAAGVAAILHAGDICTPRVLERLGAVAPVYAVRGNRDWVLMRHLPATRLLEFGGVRVGLAHGHGRWRNYFLDRVNYMLNGFELERYTPRLLQAFADARVIVFGHIHRRLIQWSGGQLLINPGSPHVSEEPDRRGTLGLLHIGEDGAVNAEFVFLDPAGKA